VKLKDSDNKLAHFLNEQGNYVINVAGVDWYDYSGFMVPAYLPHCCPVITRDLAVEVLRESKRPFARWSSRFGKVANSEWWCILKRGPWAIEDIKDRDKRYKIRKEKKNFIVRPLTSGEISGDCPRVTQLAASRYKTKTQLETPDSFKRSVDAYQKVPGVIEYIGCFHDNVLASFSENYIQDGAVFCNTIRHDPVFLKENSSYAIIDGMLNYYLNEMKFEYLSNGWRNLYHETEFHEHLISVFGYTKEYSLLNAVYHPAFAIGVKTAYAFRGAIWSLSRRWKNSTLDKVSGILRQEYIRRACESQRCLSDKL
jgi:hypothetical protein